jgi:hypothetical protein
MIGLFTKFFARLVVPGGLTALAFLMAFRAWPHGREWLWSVFVFAVVAFMKARSACRRFFGERSVARDRVRPPHPGEALRFLFALTLGTGAPLLVGAGVFLLFGPPTALPHELENTRALLAAVIVAVGELIPCYVRPLPANEVVRGGKLLSLTEARRRVGLSPGDPGLPWGGLLLPGQAAVTHFLGLGATGVGKTLLCEVLATSALRDVGRGRGVRGLWFDAKNDSLSFLSGLGVPWKTFNPFDERAVAWDMAQDVTDPTLARGVAEILFPVRATKDAYFETAAQELFRGTLESFIELSPGAWLFADAIHALRSKDRLAKVLGRTPQGQELIELYLTKESTALDVMSTVANRTGRYLDLARLWARAGERMSLRDWLENEYVLVLGTSHLARPTARALNQAVFHRLSQLLLDLPASETSRYWIFIDEVRQAGRLDGLLDLAIEGRSRGVALALFLQDPGSLRAPELYGEHGAVELLGECANVAIMRLESPLAQQWASALFGRYEALEVRRSQSGRPRSLTDDPASESEGEQLLTRDVVIPAEFGRLPPTDRAYGLTAFFKARTVGYWKATLTAEYLDRMRARRDPSVLDFLPVPVAGLPLPRWTEEDCRRLGLPPELSMERDMAPVVELAARRRMKASGLKDLEP